MASIFEKNPFNLDFNAPVEEIALVAGQPNPCKIEFEEDDKDKVKSMTWQKMDAALCKQLRKCGFNLAAADMTLDDISDSLDNCKNAGIKLFVGNSVMSDFTQGETLIKKLMNHEGLAGWKLDSNFTLNDLDINENTTIYDTYYRINCVDVTQKPIFIGIPGDWNRDGSNNRIESYPSFIAKFQQLFKPSFWAFSYFPDMLPIADMSDDMILQRRIEFYKTLQYFAYISRYTATPFWIYCRCQAVRDYYGYGGKPITEEALRGIVFSALSYGAQGFLYWNYRSVYNPGGYSDAPIDSEGNKTETWKIVKKINSEVRTFNDVFYGCELVECFHLFPKNGNFEWLREFKYPVGPLMNVEVENQNNHLLISHIYKEDGELCQDEEDDGDNGRDYLIIMNASFDSANSSIAFVTLQFSEYWKIFQLITITDGSYTETEMELTSPQYRLRPGDYLIFRWE